MKIFSFLSARPLLAFKRDLSRPTSTLRTSSDHESELESPSTPSTTEPIEAETNGSLKTIFDKVKNTLSPAITKRVTLEMVFDEKTKSSFTEQRHSSISSQSGKDPRNNRLRHQKSVSFAENVPQPTDSLDYADPILVNSHDDTATVESLLDESDQDFQRDFHRAIKPRRISIGMGKDLAYQDLSAEIVAYILKHALRTVEQEDEELRALTEQQARLNTNVEDDDSIDLK